MLMPSIFGERLFDDFFFFVRPARELMKIQTPANGIMKTDVKETENGYELEIDLPGYTKEDVKGEIKDGYLTISATTSKNNDEKDEKTGRYIRRERYYGSCSRSFYVGEEVTEEDIKAKFENGILKVCIPKKEAQPQVEEKKFIAIEG